MIGSDRRVHEQNALEKYTFVERQSKFWKWRLDLFTFWMHKKTFSLAFIYNSYSW